jgi:hypothetical protein
MKVQWRVGALLVGLLVVVAGCGPDPVAMERELLRAAFAGMDAAQADALADGGASRGEYEAAVRRARACLVDAGMELDAVEPFAPDGSANVGGFLAAGRDPALVDGCLALLTPITEVYLLQHASSEEELVAVADAAVRCLRLRSVTVPDGAALPDIVDAAMRDGGFADQAVQQRRACVDPLIAAAAVAPPGTEQALERWLDERA